MEEDMFTGRIERCHVSQKEVQVILNYWNIEDSRVHLWVGMRMINRKRSNMNEQDQHVGKHTLTVKTIW